MYEFYLSGLINFAEQGERRHPKGSNIFHQLKVPIYFPCHKREHTEKEKSTYTQSRDYIFREIAAFARTGTLAMTDAGFNKTYSTMDPGQPTLEI